MFQRVGPNAFKKDLKNITIACEALGNPHQKFKSIHIAGTNGKGSTAHMLASVFIAAGYKTGLYTSPHYKDFRERIKINGELISKRQVVDFVKTNKTVFEKTNASFFEWTVALTFDYFANEKVDIAIIETGLGGRLDSTNIITPMLSVITNIGFDHTDMLGDTRPLIAGEKAGIIKAKIPVVIGETHQETSPVFNYKAKELNTKISFADKEIKAEKVSETETHTYFKIKKNDKEIFSNLGLQHLGAYQKNNLITALQSLFIFNKNYPNYFNDLDGSIKKGIANFKTLSYFIGRWEYISHAPRILIDSAHNEDGIKQLVTSLKKINYNKLHFVIGVVGDKSHEKTFSLLPKNAVYYFAKAKIPRGMNAKNLQAAANDFGLKGKSYISIKKALSAAKMRAKKDDLIFVGGSIFTVAEVL